MQSHFHKSKYKYSTKSELHDWQRLELSESFVFKC